MTVPFRLHWIATGAGHCGTGYVARVLTSLGIVCGHEDIYRRGSAGPRTEFEEPGPWGHPWSEVRAESSWGAIYHLNHEYIARARLIYIVRDPVKVIESWWRSKGGLVKGESSLIQAMTHFCLAHDLIIGCRQYLYQYKVEDGPWGLAEIVGVKVPDGVFDDRMYNQHVEGKRILTTFDSIRMICDDPLVDRCEIIAKEQGY